MSEPENIRRRYRRRAVTYDPFDVWVCLVRQSVERAIVKMFHQARVLPVGNKALLEIGCGSGDNLLHFLRLGFRPENMVGNELIDERASAAQHVLPMALQVVEGDAMSLRYGPASFDIVFQSMVFSSILDDGFRADLAARMWDWVRPGGGILWYDFTYDNPSNSDVRGVRLREVARLFPLGKMRMSRVTLAPPIGRRAAKIHPAIYGILDSLPWLRTHVLCWIAKQG